MTTHTSTLPPPPHVPTTIAPNARGRRVLRRRFILADHSSVSLTLAELSEAEPLRYRMTHHLPGTKAGATVTVFAGSVEREATPDDTAEALLQRLLVLPGEPGDERLGAYSPDQLAWVLKHATELRVVTAARLGWSPPAEMLLATDVAVIAEVRADLRASERYRLRFGVIQVQARTKAGARAELARALGAHCSMPPAVRVGARTRDVYLLYPLGKEFVFQLVHPGRPGRELGQSTRFEASSAAQALAILDSTVEHREVDAKAKAKAVPLPPPPTSRPPRAAARRGRLSVRPSTMPGVGAP